MSVLWSVVGTMSVVAWACRSSGGSVASTNPGVTRTSSAAVAGLMTDARVHWTKRDDEEELAEAIQIWERVLELDPTHTEALTALSRACYFLADAFLALEADHPDIEFAAYQKGVDYGERALLLLEPEIDHRLHSGLRWPAAVEALKGPGVGAAYWYAANLGRFASKQGLSTQVYYRDQLQATVTQVEKRAPGYYFGGPDRFLGAYYAALPPIAGRDLERSEQHFAAAKAYAPHYLVTQVLEARFLAVAKGDRARFERILHHVVESPSDDPQIGPENRAAQRAAHALLERAGQWF